MSNAIVIFFLILSSLMPLLAQEAAVGEIDEIIQRLDLAKKKCSQDPGNILATVPYFPLSPAASEDDIRQLELAVGHVIPDGCRQFLQITNGWRGVHIYASMFSSAEIINKCEAYLAAQEFLEMHLLENDRTNEEHLLTIGKNDTGRESVFIDLKSGMVLFLSVDGVEYPGISNFLNDALTFFEEYAGK